MPEPRFLKIIIVALLLINIGTLSYLWLGMNHNRRQAHPPHYGPPPAQAPGGPAAFLREELQLTDTQEAAYRKMRREHHKAVMDIREQMRENKRALYTLLKATEPTSVASEEQRLLDSLATQQRRIEDITYEHFREVRILCTPRQQVKFDEVIGDALEQMR